MPKPKPRKPKAKKRKRLVIHMAVIPLAEALPLVNAHAKKRKPQLDVNQMASKTVQATIRESEK
jgi:hypothetical protein